MSKIAIVCVDDEAIILSSLNKQLKRGIGSNYDIEIELASGGKEAIELCNKLTAEGIAIALIIADRIMPGISGDELLIKLHGYYPQALKILLTGQANVESIGNVVNAAALYRYIAKPWDETDFILTVKEALRRYGQEQQLAEQNLLLHDKNNELQRSNKKLSKTLKLLLAIFETVADGIVVLDNKGEVIISNQKFADLWQVNINSVKGDSNHISGLIARRLMNPEVLKEVFYQDPLNPQKTLLKLHNGTILEAYFKVQVLEGKIVGQVWGFCDVTAREKEKNLVK